jgi:hypothetical protein
MIVVGQTPPPFGGQAIMIQRLLDLETLRVEKHCVPMRFSRQMSGGSGPLHEADRRDKNHCIDHGNAPSGAQVSYYHPAGPSPARILRDLVILISTRWIFQRVVFHFHAAGLGEYDGRTPVILRSVARLAYGSPDLAIETAHGAPRDGAAIRAKRSIVVWNGVEEAAAEFDSRARSLDS